jgi:short subunit dehydrogenase-like uncharacterized protein
MTVSTTSIINFSPSPTIDKDLRRQNDKVHTTAASMIHSTRLVSRRLAAKSPIASSHHRACLLQPLLLSVCACLPRSTAFAPLHPPHVLTSRNMSSKPAMDKLGSSRAHSTQRYSSMIPSPVDADGRKIGQASITQLVTTLASLPVWAVTVLPLSVVYQVGKACFDRISSPAGYQPESPLDSGIVVDASAVKPRAERKYDIVVLGATGFTGKLAVRYLAKEYGVDGSKGVKWAMAGRSQSKLDGVKKELADELGMDLSTIDTILVDTSDSSTLPVLVEDTRCVATTAGPFALYGNSVVEFCAKYGTHYVDITGEVDWVKTMMLQWGSVAKESGARLVPFCGHDSIPWDLAVLELSRVLEENSDSLQSVTFWDEFKASAPGGTLATVFSVAEGKSIKAPRASMDPFLQLSDGSKSHYQAKSQISPYIQKTNSPWTTSGQRQYTIPFVMAPVNGSVVRWSHAQRQQGHPRLTYNEAQVVPDLKTAIVNYAGMIMLGSALLNPLTASVLKRYVLPQSGQGPSKKTMLEKNYLCIHGQGIGTNGNTAECILYFKRDVACWETSKMLIEAGLCLVLQEDDLPAKQGGFYSPAASMGGLLLERILKNPDVVFECVVVPKETTRSKL